MILPLTLKLFDHPDYVRSTSKQLLKLKQGADGVADYSVNFWTLASDSKWNEEALRGALMNGLSEAINDELAVWDEPDTLNDLVSLAIKLDNRLRERKQERSGQSHPPGRVAALSRSHTPSSPLLPSASPVYTSREEEEEAMQLDRARLSPAERQRRMQAGECLYCGNLSHHVANSPSRPKNKTR